MRTRKGEKLENTDKEEDFGFLFLLKKYRKAHNVKEENKSSSGVEGINQIRKD